jgi:transposase
MTVTKPKSYIYFIGIDISKDELDFAVMYGNDFLFHQEINNKTDEIKALISNIKLLPKFAVRRSLFVMEQTGVYSFHLVNFLKKIKANFVIKIHHI